MITTRNWIYFILRVTVPLNVALKRRVHRCCFFAMIRMTLHADGPPLTYDETLMNFFHHTISRKSFTFTTNKPITFINGKVFFYLFFHFLSLYLSVYFFFLLLFKITLTHLLSLQVEQTHFQHSFEFPVYGSLTHMLLLQFPSLLLFQTSSADQVTVWKNIWVNISISESSNSLYRPDEKSKVYKRNTKK